MNVSVVVKNFNWRRFSVKSALRTVDDKRCSLMEARGSYIFLSSFFYRFCNSFSRELCSLYTFAWQDSQLFPISLLFAAICHVKMQALYYTAVGDAKLIT